MAAQIVQDINRVKRTWNLLGFLDDDLSKMGTELDGLTVMGSCQWLASQQKTVVVIAIGSPARRWRTERQLTRLGHSTYASLVHPLAWLGARVSVGHGCLVYPGTLVDVDVEICDHVLINKACTIGHDSMIGAFATIAPGVNLGGSNRLGEGCELGIACCTIQSISVGAWSIVGAGSVITQDLPVNVTAVGVPGKVIKRRSDDWYTESNEQ
jgi:sugar O-acyltransferase (sialic acid O-acetyltransferase NeuD family)